MRINCRRNIQDTTHNLKAMVSPAATPSRLVKYILFANETEKIYCYTHNLGSKTFAFPCPTVTLCWAAETTEARTEAEATKVVKKRMVIFLNG